MENFNALGLPQPLLSALEKMQFSTPTPIQAQAVPPALLGRDILGSAQTGTGKTAAFAIPLIAKLLKDPQGMAIVMTPTRELAAQVLAAMQKMLVGSHQIKTALLIGGESMFKQLNQLKSRPRIIVGTPGRINDHLERRSLNLSTADFLVLDETDRMLDMGFGVQIDRVLSTMPKQRQTLLFSATLPAHIVKIAERYMNNPVRIAVGALNAPIKKIQQELVRLPVPEKYNALLKELRAREGSIIVFVKTKRGADRMAKKLGEDNHSAAAIHGNLNQGQRNRVIQAFRDKKHRIMVATDVAARGLDIPHIEHVINYDLPQVAEDYIHRIGRTARAGAEGAAVCFITPEDFEMWGEIDALLNPDAPRAARPPQGKAKSGYGKPQQRSGHNASGFQARTSQHRRGDGAKSDAPSPYAKPRYQGDRSEGRTFKQGGEGRPARASGDRPYRDAPKFRDGDFRDAPREERGARGGSAQGSSGRPRSDRPYNNDRPRSDRSYDERPKPAAPQGRRFDGPRDEAAPRGEYRGNRPQQGSQKGYGKPGGGAKRFAGKRRDAA